MNGCRFRTALFVAVTLSVGGCVTQSDLDPYAKKSDLDALRSELMTQITQSHDSAQRAEQEASAASQSAQSAAASAATAAQKSDYIYQEFLKQ